MTEVVISKPPKLILSHRQKRMPTVSSCKRMDETDKSASSKI